MNINIFGSTGIIGIKSLDIIAKYFPNLKINLLVANNNYKKLYFQIKKFKPKYIALKNKKNLLIISDKINALGVKIIDYNEVNNYLENNKSDFTILSISGYESLFFLEQIFKNTKFLGLVNKECVVSAGHLFKKMLKNNPNLRIYPLDSEHYSLLSNLHDINNSNYNKIILTASGGPFFNKKNLNLKKIKFVDAIKHPKWNMGYKNSIDSATLANKCLEIIEAHYLFSIPFKKIDISIHPESLIHSIVEKKNLNISLNYFYPDMFIPIYNFFKDNIVNTDQNLLNKKFQYKNQSLNFYKVNPNEFPIYKIFKNIDSKKPINLIKFNCANQCAVDLFKNNKINYIDIPKFINNAMKISLDYPVNTIKNVIKYQYKFNLLLNSKYEN